MSVSSAISERSRTSLPRASTRYASWVAETSRTWLIWGCRCRRSGRTSAQSERWSGGTSANVVHVMKNPANPNAAKLFINWFLSREGQTAVHDLVAEYSGRTSPNSLRLDVPKDNVDPAEIQKPDREYVNIDAPEHVAKRDEIIAQVREWYQAAN